jgi:hypothetical protein
MAFGIAANPYSFNATGQKQPNAAFDPNYSALGQGDPNRGPESAVAEENTSADSLEGYGLPENIINDIVAKGAEGINKSQDSALHSAADRAAGSGFSVSGDLNKANDSIMSDYASKRAGNERDTRIAAATQALENKKSAGGFQAASGGSRAPSGGSGGGSGGSPMANWLQGQVGKTPQYDKSGRIVDQDQANMEIGLQGFQFARPSIAGGGAAPLDLGQRGKPRVQEQPANQRGGASYGV